jgi:hypothetical protein
MVKKRNSIGEDCDRLSEGNCGDAVKRRKKNNFQKSDEMLHFFLKDPARAWGFFVCTLSFWWYARQFIDKSFRYQQRGVKTTE